MPRLCVKLTVSSAPACLSLVSLFLCAGEWCHVFPEGGIWQNKTLGGRGALGSVVKSPASASTSSATAETSTGSSSSSSSSPVISGGGAASSSMPEGQLQLVGEELPPTQPQPTMDRLKWGIGKLIAHAPVPPAVVPFFFMGTETAYPQHPVTKALSNKLPIPGCNVDVRFGGELDFTDLIEAHEAEYGPLWKYKASVKFEAKNADGSDVNFHTYWDSRPSDYVLYAKIARRVEEALVALNEEYNRENGVV